MREAGIQLEISLKISSAQHPDSDVVLVAVEREQGWVGSTASAGGGAGLSGASGLLVGATGSCADFWMHGVLGAD